MIFISLTGAMIGTGVCFTMSIADIMDDRECRAPVIRLRNLK